MPLNYYSVYNHYWIVAGSTTQVWSSAAQQYVPVSDGDYVAWLALGYTPTTIDTETNLWNALIGAGAANLLTNVASAQDELEAYHTRYSFLKNGAAHTFRATQLETGPLLNGQVPAGFSGNLLQLGADDAEPDLFSVNHNGDVVGNDALLANVRTDTVGAGGQNTNVALYGVQAGHGSTITPGLIAENTTDAADGAQQHGPVLVSAGRGWKTNATAASQPVYAGWQAVPVQGAANPSVYLRAVAKINTGAWSSLNVVITSDSKMGIGLAPDLPAAPLHVNNPLDGATSEVARLQNSGVSNPGAGLTFYGGSAEDARIEGRSDECRIYTGSGATLRATFGTTITLAVGLSVAGGYTQSATGANTFISNVTVSPTNANGTLGVTVSSNSFVPKITLTQSGAIAWDQYLSSTAGDWMLDIQGGQNAIKVTRTGTNVANVCLPNGQVAIGTTSPTTSAKLDVSSTTGALLPPRMTSTQRDALTAAAGMVIYNTTTSKLQVYTSSWVDLH